MKIPTVPLNHGSHLPVLAFYATKYVQENCVEIGGGLWSTPMLHGICAAKGAELATFENSTLWRQKLSHMDTHPHHRFDLGRAAILDLEWDLAFIDSSPPASRQVWLSEIKARIYVCHDTNRSAYGWDFSGFPFVHVYDTGDFQTTVASRRYFPVMPWAAPK